MKLRKANNKDFKELAKILQEESSKKPYGQKWVSTKAIKEIKDMAKDELYIAEVDKKIAGFISANITADSKDKAYIRELWLKPEYQGQGVGKALTKHIEKMYKKKGVKILRLVTLKTSKAFGFYNKLKYHESKRQVFMEKKLG